MNREVLIPALLLLATPATAVAQTVTTNASAFSQTQRQINLEDVETDEDVTFQLRWTPSHAGFQGYEYALVYEAAVFERTPEATDLVDVEDVEAADEPEGTSVSGASYIVYVRPSSIVPASAVPSKGGVGERQLSWNIVLQLYPSGTTPTETNTVVGTWTFSYDTDPPPPITITSTAPGEDRVQVQWNAPAGVDDILRYEMVYCPRITTATVVVTESTKLTNLPCDEGDWEISEAGTTSRVGFIEDGLANEQLAAVAIRAVDEFGNVGELSEAWVARPRAVTDFYELYRQGGGTEDGGFCFVATAAYGSYAHPVVRVLRGFRDSVLADSPVGQALIWGYYRASPAIAAALPHESGLAGLARVLLVLVALAVMGLMLLPVWAVGMILWRLVRRSARAGRAAAFTAVVLAGVGVAPTAQAERPKSTLDTIGLGFEFKGGPYLPAMGNVVSDEPGAFVRIFGSNPNALIRMGGELQLYRGIGTAAIGGSIGYMKFSGNGLFEEDGTATGGVSGDSTSLHIMPLALVGVYRFDWLVDRTWVPLVPYVKGGLAYYVWWATNGKGEISRYEGEGSRPGGDIARGGKFGLTGSLGISFLLNWLEPRSASSLYEATNIRGTYFFAEVEANKVNGFEDAGFDFSDVTWNLGLFMEF